MRREVIAAAIGLYGCGFLAWDWHGFSNDEHDQPLLCSGSILMIESIDMYGYVVVRIPHREARLQMHSGWLLPVRIGLMGKQWSGPSS